MRSSKLVGQSEVGAAESLQHANFSGATGLSSDDFAGCDLTGATMPADIHAFHTLPIIEENSRNSRTVFLTMLFICAYAWRTIATTVDSKLVANSVSSPLPIIGAPIPIASFYWFAPVALLAIYIYLHIYLLRLWDGLSRLPAVFPDGRRVDQRVYPWLLTGLIRRHLDRGLADRSLQARAEELVTIVLAWWTVPLTLLGIWGFYLPRHDWAWTAVHVALLALSVVFAVTIYRTASAIMEMRGNYAFEPRHLRLGVIAGIATLVVAAVLSFSAVQGLPMMKPWVTASLRDRELSTRPAGYWTISDIAMKDASVTGADLEGRDLRFADARRAFLVNADLTGAKLNGADLRGAILRGAVLMGAELDKARLEDADLTGATGLTKATLAGASVDCNTTKLPHPLKGQNCP